MKITATGLTNPGMKPHDARQYLMPWGRAWAGAGRLPLAGEGPQELRHEVEQQSTQVHQGRVLHVAHKPGTQTRPVRGQSRLREGRRAERDALTRGVLREAHGG